VNVNPFIAPFDQLPETLPIFPLSGAIVMPGNELPLNIFEPRYINMVNDALSTNHMIGMIQPDPGAGNETNLYPTGCAGRITQYRETSDGRIEMLLGGVCRFDLGEELPTTRGYRLIIPNWSRFSGDYADTADTLRTEHDILIRTLKHHFKIKGLEADWPMLESLSTVKLVDSLSMALPLSEPDKQLLLEMIEPAERLSAFTALLDSDSESDTRH